MSELPQPVCGDCIAFSPEGRDGQGGGTVGSCRLRPELGLVPETLRYCHVFRVRRERAGQVFEPSPAPARVRRSAPRPQTSAPPARRRPTLSSPTTGDTSGEISMDRDGLKQVLRELLEEETLYGYPELGARWQGGTMVLKPNDEALQAKEVELETFFHKIVMLRDRLRVLESKINGNAALAEQEKIELQGYVTKCYGTLTTFNVLFAEKDDQFRSK